MTDLIILVVSVIIVGLIGYPIVEWFDKSKKEMDEGE